MQTDNSNTVKHTVGEWGVKYVGNNLVRVEQNCIPAKTICDCYINKNGDDIDEYEAEANAAYICEAVNNYEALKESHRELLEALQITHASLSTYGAHPIIDVRNKKAIDKANNITTL